jgi:hypothetical protein
MRNRIFIPLISVFLYLHVYGQDINCPVTESYMKAHIQKQNGTMGLSKTSAATTAITGPQDLVILFVDYPEGRKQPGNILPTTDADTTYFRNLINNGNASDTIFDAIGGMGWVYNQQTGQWNKKIRKYSYDDYWNMFFSVGTYYGAAHPDSASHGILAYGSFRDYYREVSYNNIDIRPYTTRSTGSNKYQTGIVNAIDSVNGKKYIRWIMMPKSKSSYTFGGEIKAPWTHADVDSVIRAARSRGETTLDIDTYQGKVIIVGAGSPVGGISDCDRYSSVREKRYNNWDNNSTLDGIWVSVHEYGHTLKFWHLASSSYDPMNVTLSNSWIRHLYCPPHFNPLYKLQTGWISTNNFTSVHNNNTLNLFPSHSYGSFAAVTIYGDALRNSDLAHSEYYVLEYRTRNGFNQFSGGQNPTSFKGGVLLWHYSKYNTISFDPSAQTSNIGLKIAGYCDNNNNSQFRLNTGDPSHFYYNNSYGVHNTFNAGSSPNSSSRENLTTGINLSDFSLSDNRISVTVNYDSGAVPAYTNLYSKDSSIPATLSGNVYLEDGVISTSLITITDGTTLTIAPNATLNFYYGIISNAGSQGNILLRGAGFGANIAKWSKLSVDGTGVANLHINFHNNTISDLTSGLYIRMGSNSTTFQPDLSNITFSNCISQLIDLSGAYSSPPPVNYDIIFPNLNGTNYTSLAIHYGSWIIPNGQNISIPAGSNWTISTYYDPNSFQTPITQFKMGTNSNFNINGVLNAQGISAQPITFTSASGSSPGSWGSIILNGASNSSSILKYIKMQYGTMLQFLYGANATLQYSTIQNNVHGVYIYCAEPHIINNTILDPQSRGISCVGGAYYPKIGINVITKTQGGGYYKTFEGINAAYTHGYVYHNDIKGFNWGMNFGSSSYATFTDENGTSQSCNNRIRDCNYGIGAYYSTIAMYMASGYNSIYNNSYYDLYAQVNSNILDTYNYYGGGFPKIFNDGTSIVTTSNLLASDPWGSLAKIALTSNGMDIKSPQTSIKKDSVISVISWDDENEILKGREYERQKDTLSAINLYKQMIKSNKLPKQALAELARIGNQTTNINLLKYFESIKDNKTSYQAHGMELLAGMYLRQGVNGKCTAMYDEIIAKFPNTLDERIAYFQKYYFTLHVQNDKKAAVNILNKIKSKYSNENTINEEIDFAQFVLDHTQNLMCSNNGQAGKETITERGVPIECKLYENYPNPFNPSTHIQYQLPATSRVSLKVYDLLGREVAVLVDEMKDAGSYTITFDGSKHASGIYFVRMNVQPQDDSAPITKTMKMLMLK